MNNLKTYRVTFAQPLDEDSACRCDACDANSVEVAVEIPLCLTATSVPN